MIATLFQFGKKKTNPKVTVFTENDVRDEIFRRSIVNTVAREEALKAKKTAPAPAPVPTTNPHAATIAKLNEILDKVSGYENSKIRTLAELTLALESGNFTELMKVLKTKDKVVRLKAKKLY